MIDRSSKEQRVQDDDSKSVTCTIIVPTRRSRSRRALTPRGQGASLGNGSIIHMSHCYGLVGYTHLLLSYYTPSASKNR